jgi:hypothetical protein
MRKRCLDGLMSKSIEWGKLSRPVIIKLALDKIVIEYFSLNL